MSSFQVLLTLLDAALEHVPPKTRSVLQAAAKQHVEAVEVALKKNQAGPK